MRGRPRFTQDVDVLLDVPQIVLPGLLDDLAELGFEFDMARPLGRTAMPPSAKLPF